MAIEHGSRKMVAYLLPVLGEEKRKSLFLRILGSGDVESVRSTLHLVPSPTLLLDARLGLFKWIVCLLKAICDSPEEIRRELFDLIVPERCVFSVVQMLIFPLRRQKAVLFKDVDLARHCRAV